MDFTFYYEDGSEAIFHHGVKGMKWGVRKRRDYTKLGYRPDQKRIDKLQKKLKTAKTDNQKYRYAQRLEDEKSGFSAKRRATAAKIGIGLGVVGLGVNSVNAISSYMSAASMATIAAQYAGNPSMASIAQSAARAADSAKAMGDIYSLGAVTGAARIAVGANDLGKNRTKPPKRK